jgi:hypothetical protein
MIGKAAEDIENMAVCSWIKVNRLAVVYYLINKQRPITNAGCPSGAQASGIRLN